MNPTAARLQAFLYGLLRDHLPAGKVEVLAADVERIVTPSAEPIIYSNSYLADYALELVGRLAGGLDLYHHARHEPLPPPPAAREKGELRVSEAAAEESLQLTLTFKGASLDNMRALKLASGSVSYGLALVKAMRLYAWVLSKEKEGYTLFVGKDGVIADLVRDEP